MVKQIVLAFFGSVFPVILFNIDRKKIVYAGLCGALGWLVYCIIFNNTGNYIMASFAGTFTVGSYSELMARKLKTPASMFSIPGIFPLVPGITAYNTISCIVEGNLIKAFNLGMQVLAVGGSIGFGIMLSSTLVRFISKMKEREK